MLTYCNAITIYIKSEVITIMYYSKVDYEYYNMNLSNTFTGFINDSNRFLLFTALIITNKKEAYITIQVKHIQLNK